MADDLASAILASSQRLGVSPVDLATVISYETGGTFDPWKAGPTTQYGQHRGLIQWGEPQRQQFGVYQGMPNAEQMQAVEKYLTNAGVKPGMGLMDVYSAVNAGRVGRYGASDANNGGAPGTVADKVNNQMGGHRQKAMALLGGQFNAPTASPAGAGMAPSVSGMFAPQQVAAGVPTAPGPQIGALAELFTRNMQGRQKQREEEQAAEQVKRAALFDTPAIFG